MGNLRRATRRVGFVGLIFQLISLKAELSGSNEIRGVGRGGRAQGLVRRRRMGEAVVLWVRTPRSLTIGRSLAIDIVSNAGRRRSEMV